MDKLTLAQIFDHPETPSIPESAGPGHGGQLGFRFPHCLHLCDAADHIVNAYSVATLEVDIPSEGFLASGWRHLRGH